MLIISVVLVVAILTASTELVSRAAQFRSFGRSGGE